MYNIKKTILILIVSYISFLPITTIATDTENKYQPNDFLRNFLISSRSTGHDDFDIQLPKHIEDIMMHGNYVVLDDIIKNEKNDYIKQLAKKSQDRLTNGLRSRNASEFPTTVNDGSFGLADLVNWEFINGDLLRSGRIHDWATYTETLRTGPFRSLSSVAGGDIQHFWHLIPVEFTANPSEISDPSIAGSGSDRIPYLEKEKAAEKHIPISISNKLYTAQIDTGTFFGHIPDKYLNNIEYKTLGNIYSMDAIGNKITSHLIQIKSINIGKYVFNDNLFIVDEKVSNIILGLNSLRLLPTIIISNRSIEFNPSPIVRCVKRLLISSNLAGGTAIPIITGAIDDSGPVPIALDTGDHVDYQNAGLSNIEPAPVTFISPFNSPGRPSAIVSTPQGRHLAPVVAGKNIMLSVQDGLPKPAKSLTLYAKQGMFSAYLNDTFLWNNDVFLDFEKGNACIYSHQKSEGVR
ncbi:hypothetical protein AD940_07720 [Gluconobacter thailandicus]|uniref:hypothetical protein n=1 Tax=Gluconobacter thailandicus TaxID=257438 RepID=UPI000777BF9A|nr:hypothetical protein [Gluconobacter thailandicus]KXV34278.1 hypothetical protein AD940_07720 [Gluconobacter thailandicus]